MSADSTSRGEHCFVERHRSSPAVGGICAIAWQCYSRRMISRNVERARRYSQYCISAGGWPMHSLLGASSVLIN